MKETDKKVKHIKDLYRYPEKVKEYLQLEPYEIEAGPRSLLWIVYESKFLPKHLQRLFFEILKHGEANILELSKLLKLDKRRVEEQIDELYSWGHVTKVDIDRETRYSISTLWKIERFPEGPIIPLIYHYNLLCDDNRINAFAEAIKKIVMDNNVVADLGAGVGIQSLIASKKAKKVYSVEIEPRVFNRGIEIVRENKALNIEYIRGDARVIDLPEKVDVIICEMIDTALISELQVPVINYALQRFLKPGGKVIPYSAKTTVQLVNADFTFLGGTYRLIHYQAYGARASRSLSKEVSCHKVLFQEINPEIVDIELILSGEKDGILNALRLKTYVIPYKGSDPVKPSDWFNPPIVLPIKSDMPITKGDKMKVNLRYSLGGGWSSLHYEVEKIAE